MPELSPRQFISDVARQFPDAPAIDYLGDDQFELVWKGARLETGVSSAPSGSTVFLGQASCDVALVAEAVTILKAIFSDEIVAMTAIDSGHFVRYFLTRTEDPTAVFNDGVYRGRGFNTPLYSRLLFRSWTGAADFGDDPTPDELGTGTAVV